MIKVRVLDQTERDGRHLGRRPMRSNSRAACRASPSRRAASRPPPPTASTAAGRPGRAKRSGSSAPSPPASPPTGSTGAAPPATTATTCASANGKPRTPSGSGSTVRPPWASPRRSPSRSKIERALVLGLALADILVRGGERVGHDGPDPPDRHSRSIVDRLAEASPPTGRPPICRRGPLAAADRGRADRRLPLPGRTGARDHRAARGAWRARPCGADRRSGRGDLPVRGPGRARRPRGARHAARRRRRVVPRDVSGAHARPSRRAAPRPAPAGAGASRCIAPTGRRPRRCWRWPAASPTATPGGASSLASGS